MAAKKYVYMIGEISDVEVPLNQIKVYEKIEDWQHELGKLAAEWTEELNDRYTWDQVEVQ